VRELAFRVGDGVGRPQVFIATRAEFAAVDHGSRLSKNEATRLHLIHNGGLRCAQVCVNPGVRPSHLMAVSV